MLQSKGLAYKVLIIDTNLHCSYMLYFIIYMIRIQIYR